MKEVSNKKIVDKIVEAIQNKKGHKIVVVDLRKLEIAPCEYFVICEGNSNTQVAAIADEIEDMVRNDLKVKPFATDGEENAVWICMDYSQIFVHIFQREAREFYDIEHLWEDAKITEIDDIE